MSLYKKIIGISVGILVIVLFAFTRKQEKIVNNTTTKLYFCLGEYGVGMTKLMKSKGIIDIKYVNDAQFMSDKEYVYDESKLKNEINRSFPNANDSGIAYIDLESPYMERIHKPEDKEAFNKSIQLFVDVIRFAKKYRPNVKWGYYYIPLTTYWDQNEEFYKKNEDDLNTIIKECDILFPSLYHFYDQIYLSISNKNYYKRNVEESIKLGIKYNKPVILFVWHRYHPSNKNVPNELIPDDDWKNIIKEVSSNSYKNKFLDGILWWGADDYSYRVNEKAIHKEFQGTANDFKIFNDKVLMKKAQIILNQLQYYKPKTTSRKQPKTKTKTK